MYYLYGETVIYYFKHVLLVDKVLLPFATHHRFIRLVLTWPFNAVADSSSSFMLYIMGTYNLWGHRAHDDSNVRVQALSSSSAL